MKSFIFISAFLALALATPLPGKTLTYYDNDGHLVTENLDEPPVSTYSVDMDKLRFIFYTKATKNNGIELKNGDAAGLKKSGFSGSKCTKFLIHGWQNDFLSESVQLLKDAFLESEDCQVCALDYKAFNSPYISAYGDAKDIAKQFATFIEFLISNGLNKNNIHILGHSLGAHIAGFCAKFLGNIPHVTGLDPAGPIFDDLLTNDGRLNSKDAKNVDCIHTSTEFGTSKSCGSMDFFPNGGTEQPSCQSAAMSGGCDHSASYRYYAEAIKSNNKFPAKSCKSIEEAQEKGSKCSTSLVHMGPNAFNLGSSGIFYVPV